MLARYIIQMGKRQVSLMTKVIVAIYHGDQGLVETRTGKTYGADEAGQFFGHLSPNTGFLLAILAKPGLWIRISSSLRRQILRSFSSMMCTLTPVHPLPEPEDV